MNQDRSPHTHQPLLLLSIRGTIYAHSKMKFTCFPPSITRHCVQPAIVLLKGEDVRKTFSAPSELISLDPTTSQVSCGPGNRIFRCQGNLDKETLPVKQRKSGEE